MLYFIGIPILWLMGAFGTFKFWSWRHKPKYGYFYKGNWTYDNFESPRFSELSDWCMGGWKSDFFFSVENEPIWHVINAIRVSLLFWPFIIIFGLIHRILISIIYVFEYNAKLIEKTFMKKLTQNQVEKPSMDEYQIQANKEVDKILQAQ